MTTIATPSAAIPAATPVERRREGIEASDWTGLFRVAALAAFGAIAFVPIQLAVLLIWPLPTAVLGWFARFEENAIGGLLDMELLMVADYVFFALSLVPMWVWLVLTGRKLLQMATQPEGTGRAL